MSTPLPDQNIINISKSAPVNEEIAPLINFDALSRDPNNATFKVTEQKVQLDVDLYKQTITGITELWIVPNDNISFLNEIQLDCQNSINVLQVQFLMKSENEDITINDSADEVLDMEFVHYNPVQENENEMEINGFEGNVFFSGGNSIEEMDYLKNKKYEPKFDPFTSNKDVNDAKLYINMAPFNHKIKPESLGRLPRAEDNLNNNYMTPLVINPPTNKSVNTPLPTLDSDSNYLKPFTIRISYYIESPTNEGVHFAQANPDIPIFTCHTTNNLLSCSASNWVPCLDILNEKCLWEVEIVTLRDLHSHIVEYPELSDTLSKYENEEITVITGDITTQNEMYISETNKRTIFTLLNPVGASGVGFAIGFFKNYAFSNNVGDLPVNVWIPQSLNLEDSTKGKSKEKKAYHFDEEDADLEGLNSEDNTDVIAEEDKLYNSFLTLPKTLEFFNNYFGTYPFNSLNVIVLKDLYVESLLFQGMCFLNYDDFMYGTDELDPIIENSKKLAEVLSVQWFGINITPKNMEEYWIIFGIQGFMKLKFIHDVLGNNEYQYQLTLNNDYIVNNTKNKPSLMSFYKYLSYPLRLNAKDNLLVEFIKIKSTMVLFILDCKMTKLERSLGIYKIINKLNILSVSGDLNNNCITNEFFQHQVEKTYKGKLSQFFKQWVFNTGVPKFDITQRFNKKKMVVELVIRQVFEENEDYMLSKNANNKSLPDLYSIPETNQIFHGNMTIRIHEADGIPYEHIIHISEEVTRLDIQYNSKYKKLKRGEHRGLGDILVTVSELNAWDMSPIITLQNTSNIAPSSAAPGVIVPAVEEDLIESGSEAYEWIRIDSDFEWIAKIVNFNMKLEMYISQLQLDKDVFAQCQSIDYLQTLILTQENFKKVEEMDLQISSALLRCILDERYFYGVRLRAIEALSTYHLRSGFKGGFNHLVLVIEKLLFDKKGDLRHNNFNSYTNYQVIRGLIDSLNKVIISDEEIDDYENNLVFSKIKSFSQKLLLFNDNSKNVFNDESYIALLIDNLVKLVIKFPNDKDFNIASFKILTKYERLQMWSAVPSTKIMKAVFWNKLLLINTGLNADMFEVYDFMNDVYSITHDHRYSKNLPLIVFAYKLLLIIGIKNKDILKYFVVKMVVVYQSNPYLRNNMIDSFVDAVTFILLHSDRILLTAYNEDFESLQKIYNPNLFNDLNKFKTFEDFERFEEPEPSKHLSKNTVNSDIILGNDSSQPASKKNVFLDNEMKMQLQKDLDIRRDGNKDSFLAYIRSLFATYDPLKQILWFLLNKKALLIDYQKLKLFEFLPLIYKQEKKFYVTLKLPSENPLIMEKGDVAFDDEGNCTQFIMKIKLQNESRFKKKAPSMKFSLSSAKFKNPKVKVKVGRKNKQSKKQPLDDAFIVPINLAAVEDIPQGLYYTTEVKKFGSLPLTSVKIDRNNKIIVLSSLSQTNENVDFLKMSKNSLVVKLKTNSEVNI